MFPVPLEKWSYDPSPHAWGEYRRGRRHQQPGQIVGLAENTTPEPDCSLFLQAKPVLWEHGKVQELPTFPGETGGQAIAINDLGQVTGLSGGCQVGPTAGLHSWLWQNGALTDLGNLGGTESAPSDINNRGQVVGASFLPGDTTSHAFLWTKSNGMQDVGTLPGDFSATAVPSFGRTA